MTTRVDIEAAWARLAGAGDALAGRDRNQTLGSLAAVFDAWSDPQSTWQRRLVDELPGATGMNRENVRRGLAAGLAHWNGDALREVFEREVAGLGPRVRVTGFPTTSVLLAGSIPMPTLLSLALPLALHSPTLAKSASRDPVTAGLFRESVLAVDEALGAALEVLSFSSSDPVCSDAFLDADCVVATGSDETIAAVARRTRPGARLVRYGHRLSIGVVADAAMSDETLADAAQALALDVSLWDQLGCLSPVAVFYLGSGSEVFAERLSEALAAEDERAPRGELPTASAAVARAERDGAAMRHAAGSEVRVFGDPKLRFTVIHEADAALRPAPLHRFVRVHPVADRDALLAAIRPLSPHLAGVALAAGSGERPSLAHDLAGLGASRICEPGTLQAPPLGWHHDNQPIVLPLARVADLEAPR